MSFPHRSAAPNAKFSGARDNPRPGVAQSPASFPVHTVLNFLMASWGDTQDMKAITSSVEAELQFGKGILKTSHPHFNYQSPLTQMLLGKANPVFLQRLPMPNQKAAAGRFLLEYVEADIEPYERNDDGSFKLDADDEKIATGATVAGYIMRVLWEASDGTMVVGSGTEGVGTLVGKDGAQAVVLPLSDVPATYAGQRGNFNVKFYQPKALPGATVDAASIEAIGNMLYRLGIYETPVGGGSMTPWYTKLGNETIEFSPVAMSKDTNGATNDFETAYREAYVTSGEILSGRNHTGPVDGTYFYEANIAKALALFHAAEKAAKPLGNEAIFVHDTNINSINLLGDTDHNDKPYRAIVQASYTSDAPNAKQIILDDSATVKLGGGSDGDCTDANYNKAIRDWVAAFGKTNSFQNMRQYPFHWFYDMGLENATTEELYKINAARPDTVIAGAPFEFGTQNTQETYLTKTVSLATAASLIPESNLFGTPASRGVITPCSMRIRGHDFNRPVSLNYALAEKISDYAGSADGKWRREKDPLAPNNKGIGHEVLDFRYMPEEFREKAWASQLVAIESLGHERLGFSGVQTVNPNDSSVLNSLVGLLGLQAATIACSDTYARWVGITATPGELIDNCNDDITESVDGIDTSKVTIRPDTKITPEDYDAGYAWTMETVVSVGSQFTAAHIIVNTEYLEAIQ